jgi:hypothetical protein
MKHISIESFRKIWSFNNALLSINTIGKCRN